MAKISPVSIKYMIYAKFEAEGAVEKPDIIGALFGQTEGLLGSDLELRDLQKEGKIGRIEVDLTPSNGKTTGVIKLPSALDKTETTLIAAALETIDKIGPTVAKIEIEKIEDVRGSKRDYILDRAKKLLEQVQGTGMESREITASLKTDSRISKLQEYGTEMLPAGDLSGNEIIVVEGRADVINLLRNNIRNVIGMSGTQFSESLKQFSKEKEITLFVDGDRGGQLIVKNVMENMKVDYIAFAPDGKEVEELAGKEILYCLRKRIPASDFRRVRREYPTQRTEETGKESRQEETKEGKEAEVKITEEAKKTLKKELSSVEGTKNCLILNSNFEVIKKTASNRLASTLSRIENASVLVYGGTVTGSILKTAENFNIKHIVARNFAHTDTTVNLISL